MSHDPCRKKIVTIESGIEVGHLAGLLESIECVDLNRRNQYDARPVVRVLSNGIAIYARHAWRP